ncbi:BTB/POZ domain-containing protein 8, partial [Operophtera brumata]
IFDESIYSDLEVLCGKLKILTHSCILKARTQTFYHKLEAILHVNIGRNTFDEIYSFISDAYTECDIQHQEKEIIRYLNDKLNLEPVAISDDRRNKQECVDDSDAYVTPNCISPEEKTLSSSPSTELTKEYYALVPIEGQILDKELIEQDELSSAFKSFIQLRTETFNDNQIIQCIKPTTLSLTSSHISKINKHSIICDISKDLKDLGSNSFLFENDKDKINNATSQVRKHISEISRSTQLALKKSYNGESNTVPPESAYSPDSLIADEPSSSSDYLSAAHSASPGGSYAGVACLRENFAKMNNTTLTDSGFENNGMLESLNSHMEVMSTESAFHDLLNDEAAVGDDSVPDVLGKKQLPKPKLGNSQLALTSAYTSSIAEMNGRSSKDEKQRQNEEIVILESSSLSSETGSWESVFPPKMPEKDLCEKFINIERQNSIQSALETRAIEASNENITFQCTDFAQKSSFKSASCFIDAASLADEEERLLEQVEPFTVKTDNNFRSSSRPLPCEPKQDISPNDFSESNDNEDSLEQPDPDSIQKDISPTIFQMSLVPEDSLARENTHEDLNEQLNSTMHATPLEVASNDIINIAKSSTTQTVFMNTTPNNSIISLKPFKSYYSEGSDNDAASSNRGSTALENLKQQNLEFPLTSRPHTIRQDIIFQDLNNETSPILSGGPSVKDNFPPSGYVSTSTPLPKPIIKNIPIVSGAFTATPIPKRIIENIPIVSGAYIPPEESKPERTPKASCAPAWVVDMSKMTKPDNVASNKKPGDKTCDTLKASPKSRSNSEGCKSRGSVDSDSSEKSTHKFYIDLSTLPDALASEQNSASEASREKKNIFSMFFDLGENSSTVKEMPVRLSSSLKTCKVETKHTPSKTVKTIRKPLDTIDSNDTFEKLESLCNSSKLSISEILQNPIAIKCIKKQKEFNQSIEIQDYHRTLPREAIAPTIREESDTDQFGDNFVRLSDLDRSPVPRNDTVTTKPECFDRMTRSIPDNRWGETSHTSSRSIDIISSFHSENALSLNRLFPHLKNDISRSMPGSLSGRTTSPLRLVVSSSPGDREDLVSDMSDMSSVQSSMCRSVVENSTTEDTSHTSSLLVNCQSRLGQDLLRMFIEEIAPDVIVEVSGRRIKAHKCILSSRCQYFAGILSGGWVESAGNVISLPPFSYSVVHFALCHIYSGISTIPDSISIVELATIADMLSLEGLKEAIMFTLKAKYCHHFHEPCQVCIAGVLECFPLCSVYGLDDLYRRCLRWIAKHFRRVWPTKAFATLPSELLDKCYQELLLNLSTDSLFDTVHDCGLTATQPSECAAAGTQPNKAKATKIPVYRNPSVPHARAAPITRRREAGASGERASPTAQPRHRGSLMMATKSSSAKMVPKITKQSPTLPRSARPEPPGPPKHAGKPPHEPEHAGKPPRESEHAPPRSPLADTIPVMERSGTFLKDEPTFGDITTNIDIDDY